jgi:hypothetical protein
VQQQQQQQRALTMDELQVGHDYEVLVSTFVGLTRCDMVIAMGPGFQAAMQHCYGIPSCSTMYDLISLERRLARVRYLKIGYMECQRAGVVLAAQRAAAWHTLSDLAPHTTSLSHSLLGASGALSNRCWGSPSWGSPQHSLQ